MRLDEHASLAGQVDSAPGSNSAEGWMREAIALALSVQGLTWPNPAVGCIIVRDGVAVGRGHTRVGGRPHAERVALDAAGIRARGASVFVTLEPCSHWGKTPPCADALAAADVGAVYASLQDPDPRVDGKGFARLRAAGIEVNVGLCAAEAGAIVEGFFKRCETGRPLVSIESLQSSQGIVLIPRAFDAVVKTGPGGDLELSARREFERPPELSTEMPAAEFLHRLGEIGFTSIVVPADDPLARTLRTAQLIDHDNAWPV